MPAPSRTRPMRAPTVAATMPLLATDWPRFQYALNWLERMRTLLEASGGMTDEDQRLIVQLARELLGVVVHGCDTVPLAPHTPRPVPTVNPKPNGHGPQAAPSQQWSLNERLQELGYPDEVSRSVRIRLGQALVEAYKQQHGKAPRIADRGRGAHATRVSLYDAADLPMVDRLVREMLGEPGIEPQAPSLGEEGPPDAGVSDTAAP
jgi:hypothetical protein